MQRLFIRDLELHTAVDDIAFQSVQTDDLLVAAAVAEILLAIAQRVSPCVTV